MSLPWDPTATSFPTRKELPKIPGAPDESAWVWGKDDNLGRLNLLTPARVAAAAKLIQSGDIVNLNLPLDIPKVPAFGREEFVHEIKKLGHGVFDDKYHLNTQSGTQWDGFRHYAHIPTGLFYNNTQESDISGAKANTKSGIGHWVDHGIAGRAVLLDYRSYAKKIGVQYDAFKYHAISYEDLRKCGEAQGIDIRPESQGGDIKIGDILLIRSGFVEEYHAAPEAERNAAALRTHDPDGVDLQQWPGVKQEEAILDWIHDSYFSAVAGDAPSWEAWPSKAGYILHEYILARWGIPIGEMWDLEKLAKKCEETKRWTFFVTSAPANVQTGIGSHANALAIF